MLPFVQEKVSLLSLAKEMDRNDQSDSVGKLRRKSHRGEA